MNRFRLYFFPPTLTRIERIAAPLLYILSIAPPLIFYLGIRFAEHRAQAARAANLAPPSLPIALFASLIAASLLAALVTFTLWAIFRRRSRRRIQQLDFRLCPRCRYDLTACQSDGLPRMRPPVHPRRPPSPVATGLPPQGHLGQRLEQVARPSGRAFFAWRRSPPCWPASCISA